ncbi:MAG: S41 family peptidase [Bacteroidales bacterium]
MLRNRYLILVFGLFLSFQTISAQVFNEQVYKFSTALGSVSTFYVDSVDQDKLVEDAIVEMLKKLDPHSVYINKDDVKAMNEPLQGNFEGIGVQFNLLDDTIFIVSPISGGPSEKVGIQAGDRIVKIDSEEVAGKGITQVQVREKLMGEKGTRVTVTVKRRNENSLLDFTITRDKIPIYSLEASYMVDDETGYIRLNRFSFTTVREFEQALNDLKKKKMRNLILDLRDNGGGYLQESITLSDHFLDKDKMIVYTEGLNISKMDYTSTTGGGFKDGRLVVLLNENSASASEIVAGAIQDWDRGLIIGRRSFGKGLVQRPVNLPDGSMIRLTVARYYTPTGRLIQRPYNNGADEYSMDAVRRYTNGEYFSRDSIHLDDSIKYYTKMNNRVVYGGGGIMPDIFVPYDTVAITGYYRELVRNGIFNRYVLNYVDRNRAGLKQQFPEFQEFNSDFMVDQSMIREFAEYGEKEGVKINEKEMDISANTISIQLKALIARDLFDVSEYFEIINSRDNAFLKAMEIISDRRTYQSYIRQNSPPVNAELQ